MKRVKIDTRDIPGGKALAEYVTQIVVTRQHAREDELTKLRRKVARQKEVLSNKRPWILVNQNHVSLRSCMTCGIVFGTATESELSSVHCHGHGHFCKDGCSFMNDKCPKCYCTCGHAKGCENTVYHEDHRFYRKPQCVLCEMILCVEHVEFCRRCGDPICLSDRDQGDSCLEKHLKMCGQIPSMIKDE